jgi:hypothetical protein
MVKKEKKVPKPFVGRMTQTVLEAIRFTIILKKKKWKTIIFIEPTKLPSTSNKKFSR